MIILSKKIYENIIFQLKTHINKFTQCTQDAPNGDKKNIDMGIFMFRSNTHALIYARRSYGF